MDMFLSDVLPNRSVTKKKKQKKEKRKKKEGYVSLLKAFLVKECWCNDGMHEGVKAICF